MTAGSIAQFARTKQRLFLSLALACPLLLAVLVSSAQAGVCNEAWSVKQPSGRHLHDPGVAKSSTHVHSLIFPHHNSTSRPARSDSLADTDGQNINADRLSMGRGLQRIQYPLRI